MLEISNWLNFEIGENCIHCAIQDNSKQSGRNLLNNYQTCLIVNI